MSSSTLIIQKILVDYNEITPTKARIKDAITFFDKKRIKGLDKDVF